MLSCAGPSALRHSDLYVYLPWWLLTLSPALPACGTPGQAYYMYWGRVWGLSGLAPLVLKKARYILLLPHLMRPRISHGR